MLVMVDLHGVIVGSRLFAGRPQIAGVHEDRGAARAGAILSPVFSGWRNSIWVYMAVVLVALCCASPGPWHRADDSKAGLRGHLFAGISSTIAPTTRRLIPAKKMTAQPVPRIISAVPRSGWRSTSATGTATIRNATMWTQMLLRPAEKDW